MQDQMDQNNSQGSPFTGGFFSFGPGGANYGSFGSQNKQTKTKKTEGEITIETPTEPQPQVNKKIGEYVDFEEVDNENQ